MTRERGRTTGLEGDKIHLAPLTNGIEHVRGAVRSGSIDDPRAPSPARSSSDSMAERPDTARHETPAYASIIALPPGIGDPGVGFDADAGLPANVEPG